MIKLLVFDQPRWLPQLIGMSKHNNDYNSVPFSDTELKFSVVAA